MQDVTNCIVMQTNDVLKISPEGDFFRVWADFLKPAHHLTKREMDVLGAFLKERYILSKSIKDDNLLNRILTSTEGRKKVRNAVGIKAKHLNVIMHNFRKKGVLSKDNKFYLRLIPSLYEDGRGAGLTIYFKFDNE